MWITPSTGFAFEVQLPLQQRIQGLVVRLADLTGLIKNRIRLLLSDISRILNEQGDPLKILHYIRDIYASRLKLTLENTDAILIQLDISNISVSP